MQEIDLLSTTDAMVWAKEFVRIAKENNFDLTDDDFAGTMVGWFANAMAAAEMAAAEMEACKKTAGDAIEALGYVSAVLATRSGAWDGDAPEWFPQPPEWLALWEEANIKVNSMPIEDDGATD